jgi:hypothetical protein
MDKESRRTGPAKQTVSLKSNEESRTKKSFPLFCALFPDVERQINQNGFDGTA